jgi:Icc-related predicted phosphoesterase
MKIKLASDLHLEFSPHTTIRQNETPVDILVLAGDICVGDYFTRPVESPYYQVAHNFDRFFAIASDEFENVIYVLGNHEHYRGYIDRTLDDIREALSKYKNIHILNDQFVDIGDTRFIGSTLWTDMHRGDPLTMETLRHGMNDFKLIEKKATHQKFLPKDALAVYIQSRKFIFDTAKTHDKCVVVSHHAPSEMSVHPRYRYDYHMNGGYYSNIEDEIIDHPSIKAWMHGHMHDSFAYMLGSTSVYCNPKGYNDQNPHYNRNFVYEL